MKIPTFKSRNFTLREVLHRSKDVDEDVINVALYRMGYMQALRDMLGKPIKITSGFRDKKYNQSIGSSDNSYHRFRIDKDGRLIGANDFQVMGMTNSQAFEIIAKFSVGETYLHKKYDFIHNSDAGQDEQWVQ